MPVAEIAKPDAGTPNGLRFVGNVALTEDFLRQIASWGREGDTTPVDDALRMNSELVREAYIDRGYLDVKVDVTDVVLDASGKLVSAAITVAEGKRFKIGDLHVRASDGTIPGLEHDTLARFKSQSGGWFLRNQIKEDLVAVALTFQDQGYAAVSVDPELTMHPENGTADIMVIITRRTRATFHDVAVIGSHKMPRETLLKAFTFKEGDTFSETKLNETKQNLFDLYGKQGISVMRNVEQDPTRVSVQFEVYEPGNEMPPQRPRVPCPAQIDLAALLEKHARAYGVESAVRAALPHTFKGHVETAWRSGDTALYVDAKE